MKNKYNIPCFTYNTFDDFCIFLKSVNYNLILKNNDIGYTGRILNKSYGIKLLKDYK